MMVRFFGVGLHLEAEILRFDNSDSGKDYSPFQNVDSHFANSRSEKIIKVMDLIDNLGFNFTDVVIFLKEVIAAYQDRHYPKK